MPDQVNYGPAAKTRQYARLLSERLASIGLDPKVFGTHSLRRTKATLIYRRTGNLASEADNAIAGQGDPNSLF